MSDYEYTQEREEIFHSNGVSKDLGKNATDNEGKFLCDICEQTYSSNRYLIQYKKKHDGVKFPCKQCEYKATEKTQLRFQVPMSTM